MPYLARAGVVDGRQGPMPPETAGAGPLMAWTAGAERETLATALSMLGMRVCAFDVNDRPLDGTELSTAFKTFDALVDPPVGPAALAHAVANPRTLILLEAGARVPEGLRLDLVPANRHAVLEADDGNGGAWDVICGLLGV